AALLAAPDRVSPGNGRGRIRHRLLHARRYVAGGNGSNGQPGRSRAGEGARRPRRGAGARAPELARWTPRTGTELGLFATDQNRGDIVVRLKPPAQRSRKADAIISE